MIPLWTHSHLLYITPLQRSYCILVKTSRLIMPYRDVPRSLYLIQTDTAQSLRWYRVVQSPKWHSAHCNSLLFKKDKIALSWQIKGMAYFFKCDSAVAYSYSCVYLKFNSAQNSLTRITVNHLQNHAYAFRHTDNSTPYDTWLNYLLRIVHFYV